MEATEDTEHSDESNDDVHSKRMRLLRTGECPYSPTLPLYSIQVPIPCEHFLRGGFLIWLAETSSSSPHFLSLP
jgi:hypothetical protein